jgi:hypothetical protein
MGKTSEILAAPLPLSAARWYLLATGWIGFWISLWLPGWYGAFLWGKPQVMPTWATMAWIVMWPCATIGNVWEDGFAAISEVLRHSGAVGLAMPFACLVMSFSLILFLLSPSYLLRAPRFPRIARRRWLSWSLLAWWLTPIYQSYSNGKGEFLYGYYALAVACTLVFFAIMLTPPAARRARGFEPVMKQ